MIIDAKFQSNELNTELNIDDELSVVVSNDDIFDVEFCEGVKELETEFSETSENVGDESLILQAFKGNDGESAYEIAVKNGFIGTEEEWLESLRGDAYEHDHDERYYTKATSDELFVTNDELQGGLKTKASATHIHDERYYTQEQINEKLSGLGMAEHDHDDRYYTEAEIDEKFSNFEGGGSPSVIAYGECNTEGGVSNKIVTIANISDWELSVGSMITIKFANTNTSTRSTLNVNGSGAYPIFANSSEYTSAGNFAGYANRHITYQFNGTHWVFISWSADTQSNTNANDTANKIFLVGAQKQSSNQTTYSHDTVYVDTDGHVYSNSKQAVNLSDAQALTNKTYEGYTLGDACEKGVDNTVTEGSSNLITSGAVKTALNNIGGGSGGNVPTNHASSDTTYGVGDASNYGHLKLSNSTTSTAGSSSGVAATPAAVKKAYDAAVAAQATADEALSKGGGGGSLEPTGVEAGTYGEYNSSSSYYYVPNITVDEYGRITEASQSYLGLANDMNNGLMSYVFYSYVYFNQHLSYAAASKTADKDNYASAFYGSYVEVTSIYMSSVGANVYFPKVYNVFVYAYVDATKSTRAFIPVKDYYCTVSVNSSKGNTLSVYAKFPSEFYDYNAGESVHYIALYERTYSVTSSGSM